ncbi:MAG: protoheme IX farnesyltransferase [Rhodospirillaceae bacterium]|jgi:heme o synthase|nr:protoheme IX farnesyltransferase [Rhodospirillaceae bacterium]
MRQTAAMLYNVFKIRIGMAIMVSALAGLAVTPGRLLSAFEICALALAVLGASAAAGAFNHMVERDLDSRMKRTQTRPFVTGQLNVGVPWYSGILLLLVASVGLAWWALNPITALYVYLGAVVYGYIYTVVLKRRTAWNIVIGGLAGSFAVLAGAAAADPTPGPVPLLMAGVLFLWTPPHFWSLAMALRKDYQAAGVPMLPVVLGDGPAARVIFAHTIVLVVASLAPMLVPGPYALGPIYGTLAAVGGLYFIRASWRLVRDPGPAMAMKAFFASLVQLCAVLAGALLWGLGIV